VCHLILHFRRAKIVTIVIENITKEIRKAGKSRGAGPSTFFEK
jgi:hypothetical protein